ncbi:MAG: DUF444 family protein [Phycisphaerales bacterium]
MVSKIEQDHSRFRQIVKGRLRKDLRKFIARGEMIGKEGQKYVSIPVHGIDMPTFRYGDNRAGVGMGQGEEGEAVGSGAGQGGEQPGQHMLEVDVSLDELADILGEELKLPRIKPKGEHSITTQKDKYSGIRPVGPASLRHFKRTYREALRRQIALGTYDPANPVIIPVKDDLRFRSWTTVKKPQSNAAIVYMMDVSGSMGQEQKDLVRLQAFWIDTWLRRNYQGIESRYIVHDVAAKEVDRSTFFSVREDGGTRISSALQTCEELLKHHYDPGDWNIYLFHFSDGDNSSDADNRLCVQLLKDKLLPQANMFGYVQVKSAYGSGHFHGVLKESFPEKAGAGDDDPSTKVVCSRVNEREDIFDSLRLLFKAGK